ncbi:hypothetical protein APHAL10511_003340 [Amanita phalloides]|nr:hypothetical protein APHAL10511_003340 [Amanita phalloides]
MPTQDVETGCATQQNTVDGERRLAPSRLYNSPTSAQFDQQETIRFQEAELRRPMRSRTASRKVDIWDGQTRVKLVRKGYRSLAVICTFIAGVQAQMISISFSRTDLASQLVNAFFFAGLLADVGASVLSAASARWFEMLTPEEAEHIYAWLYDPSFSISGDAQISLEPLEEVGEEEKDRMEPEATLVQKTNIAERGSTMVEDEGKVTGPAFSLTLCGWHVTERWLYIALKAGPLVAIFGLAFLLAGVMIWVVAHQGKIVYILCTMMCLLLVILLPPFAIPHDRRKALTFTKVQRFSG